MTKIPALFFFFTNRVEERKNEITRRIRAFLISVDRKHANFFVACRGCSITPVNFTELRLVLDLGVDIVYLGRERRNENQSPRLISSDDKIPRGIRIEKRMELISIIRDVSSHSIFDLLDVEDKENKNWHRKYSYKKYIK